MRRSFILASSAYELRFQFATAGFNRVALGLCRVRQLALFRQLALRFRNRGLELLHQRGLLALMAIDLLQRRQLTN